MKKAITVVLSVLCAIFFTLGLAACNNKNNDYEVTVKSIGGAALSDVVVTLYNGNTAVAEERTDLSGTAKFDVKAGTYTVALDDLPEGYNQPSQTQTVTSNEKSLTIYLESHVIEREMPTGKTYKVGDVMYDFTITTDSGTFKLSEVLKTKKMVLINFWATWCSWCMTEMPFMAESYAKYNGEDEAAVIAITGYDSMETIRSLKEDRPYINFDMAVDNDNYLGNAFTAVSALPVSVFVDRYGVCADIHREAITSTGAFDVIFEKYLSPDYSQNFNPGNNDEEEIEWVKPPEDVKMPASSALEAAAGGTGFNGTFRAVSENEAANYDYYWPFLVGSDDKGSYIYPANLETADPTYSSVYLDFHLEAGQVISMELDAAIEASQSYFGVIFDNRQIFVGQGVYGAKGETVYLYVAREAGDYTMLLSYVSQIANKDTVKIRNIRIVDSSDIAATGSSHDERYYCATVPVFDGDEQTGWANYVEVGLGADGYYHLLDENGKPNGAFVLADLTSNGTHFSNNAVYEYITASDAISRTGLTQDELDTILAYAGYAMFSDIQGYTPVTEELQALLAKMCRNLSKDEDDAANPNEWLELCFFFVHYGEGEDIYGSVEPEKHDPLKGSAPFAALPLKETPGVTEENYATNANQIDITKMYFPRGIYAAFVPEETGLYRFRSYGKDKDGVGYTTYCYITDENGEVLTMKSDDLIQDVAQGDEKDGIYFTIYLRLERGKTYFVRCDLDGALGTFYVGIEHITEDSEDAEDGVVKVLRRMALDAYTFDLEIYEATDGQVLFYHPIILPENYGQDANGNWVANTGVDGLTQSQIYLDLKTEFAYPSISSIFAYMNTTSPYAYPKRDRNGDPIYKRAANDNIVYVEDEEGNLIPQYAYTFKLDFNFGDNRDDGIDYSEELAKLRDLGITTTNFNAYMLELLEEAERTDNYLVPVTEELALILNMFVHRLTSYRTPDIQLTDSSGNIIGEWAKGIFIDSMSEPNKPYYEWVHFCVYYDYYTV